MLLNTNKMSFLKVDFKKVGGRGRWGGVINIIKFITWPLWMLVPIFMTIHLIFVEIFQSGPNIMGLILWEP